jgi:hypothetical protein
MAEKKEEKCLTLATVYRPAHDKKDILLSEVSNLCAKRSFTLIIGRDFNNLGYSSEKNKKLSGSKNTDLFIWVINTH